MDIYLKVLIITLLCALIGVIACVLDTDKRLRKAERASVIKHNRYRGER